MGARYPGSLVARFLVNKYYAWRKKHSKPSAQPGRFDKFKVWFLHWEGLLVGGLFVGGIATMAVKLYISERMEDLNRRVERCQFYEGSCMMAGTHLAAIQNSLIFWEAVLEEAGRRSKHRQLWQQKQEQRMQLAAQQRYLWQQRCQGLCGTAWPMQYPSVALTTPHQLDSVQQHCHNSQAWQQQQQQCAEHQQHQQISQQGVQTESYQSNRSGTAANAVYDDTTTAADLTAHNQMKQQQQVEQHKEPQARQLLDSNQTQQDASVRQHYQQQQHIVEHDHQQGLPPQRQQPNGIVQEQSRWWQQRNPLCWYAMRRAAIAQQQLLQEQQQLVLGDVGLHLWQDILKVGQHQMNQLKQQQKQQQEMLFSHASQLATWKKLGTRDDQMAMGFELPDTNLLQDWLIAQASNWFKMKQQAPNASTGSDSSSSSDSDAAQHQQGVDGSSSNAEQVSRFAAVLQRVTGWVRLRPWVKQSNTPPGQQQQPPPATAAGNNQDAGNSLQPKQDTMGVLHQQWHLSMRLLLPVWVPDAVEDRDYELVSTEYVERTWAQAAVEGEQDCEDDQYMWQAA